MDAEKVFITISSEAEPNTSLEEVYVTPLTAAETGDPPNNMCRLCASETELVVPIFEGDGLQNGLADKIHKHLPIQVSPLDWLPLVVCYQCASTVLAWHELVQCCVQADRAMRGRLRVPSPTQVDQSTNQANLNQSEIIDNIKTVLTNYYHSLNMEEYSSQVELVCGACPSKPGHSTAEFVQHVLSKHSGVKSEDDITKFVKNHVTFEEALVSDVEATSDMEESEPEATESKSIPVLLCPHCESSFSSASRLVSHLNSHRNTPMELGVECCRVTYTRKRQYATHLQREHVKRLAYVTEATCRGCGHDAGTPELLRAHVAEAHVTRERRTARKESAKNQKYIPAVCPECDRTFSNKYNMLAHLRGHAHAPSARHACAACGKRYSTRGNLAAHTRAAHAGLLPHACRACGERFPTRGARDTHARLHSGARPHACTRCPAAFRAADSLRAHLAAHEDTRPHDCPLCGKKFRKRSHLNAHARTHRTSN